MNPVVSPSSSLPHRADSITRPAAPPRLIRSLRQAYATLDAAAGSLPTFSLTLEDGTTHVLGEGAPAFEIFIHDRAGLAALTSLDETRVCEAILAGSIDVEGEMLTVLRLRPLFSDRHPLRALWHKFLHALVFGQARSDRKWIAQHYDETADFYELFLDSRRAYSHGIFEDDGEPLEVAILRKLDFALAAVEARPGQRILDIGAGWGTMTEHAGQAGVRVTSLTISEPSEDYVNALIEAQGLPCRVLNEHFLEYRAEEPYDAIVNLGVTEHLPDYGATLAQYERLLKPGGRVYLDACASPTKFPFSSFTYRYVFPGNATPLCLHDYLAEVAKTPLEVLAVHNDRRSYELTCRHWAERLEASRDAIVQRWGKSVFRRFQLYLWGCVDVFSRGVFGAYRVILQKPLVAP